MSDQKRLFFSAEIVAQWPHAFPPARILDPEHRHMTLVFLGQASVSEIVNKTLPRPPTEIGWGGWVKSWVILPNIEEARAVAAVVEIEGGLVEYQAALAAALEKKEARPFFPHITVGRGAIDIEAWKPFSEQIPFYVSGIVLNESLGNSKYNPLLRFPLMAPFEEIEHTADIAFLVRGKNFQELGLHAVLALAFKFPPLLKFVKKRELTTLDEVIAALNALIADADAEIGSPFKAVSYHGDVASKTYLEWTMVVDV